MRRPPKEVWIAFLAMFIVLGGFISLFVLINGALQNLRTTMGWQENAFEVWLLCGVVLLGWKTKRGIWQLGLVCAACNLMAYLAYLQHHDGLRQIFNRLSALVMLIYILDGNGKWRRKLWGKLKSAGLTVVNAASFKRQTKEAFGAS